MARAGLARLRGGVRLRSTNPIPWLFSSVRTRLLLLIFIPISAMIALTVYYQLDQYRDDRALALDHLTGVTEVVAQNRHESLASTGTFMTQVTQAPEVKAASASPLSAAARTACMQRLHSTAESLSPTVRFGLFDKNGNVICSNDSANPPALNIAERADFQSALKTNTFAVGEVYDSKIGPVRPITTYSMPVSADGRAVSAVLRLGQDLTEATPIFAPSDAPEGSELSIVDRNGRVVTSSKSKPGSWLITAQTLDELGEPTFLSSEHTRVSIHGTEREAFVTRISDDGASPLYAVLAVPPAAIGTSLVDALFPALGIVLGIALLTFAGAWWLGDVLIGRRAAALAEAAQLARRGEFRRAAMLPEDETEFGQVAVAFNQMALQFDQTIEKLQRAVRAKDEFLGLVSHELRTPVTTILGNAQVLKNRWPMLDGGLRQSALEDLYEDSQRLRTIIENLLLVARFDTGQPLEIEPVIVRHEVQGIVQQHRQLNPDREYHVSVPDELLVVDGNFHCIGQIMSNFLGNAEKYSPRGSPISVRIYQDGESIVIAVDDRGIGLEPDEANQLFTPFYRSGRTAKMPGVGLGLSVCKRLVDVQGGRIWAEAREGGGATFAFSLPITKVEYEEGDVAPSAAVKSPRPPAAPVPTASASPAAYASKEP